MNQLLALTGRAISKRPITFLNSTNTCSGRLSLVRYYVPERLVKVPPMGDSISDGTLKRWNKQIGEFIKQDEEVTSIETEKLEVPINAPEAGKLVKVFANEEDTVTVGSDLFVIDTDALPNAEPVVTPSSQPTPAPAPVAKPAITTAKEVTKEVAKEAKEVTKEAKEAKEERTERKVKMSRMRARIAERMKESQNTYAALTTFNELDMSNAMQLRKQYKDLVLEKHGVKLGFMSAFIKATSYALQQIPVINARIEEDQIIYHDYIDISFAVATEKGLVTPVLRNVQQMNYIDIERGVRELSDKARAGRLALEDMVGGTFTISNGGVFGSLMGTPIINRPQSAILGMHGVKDRPVAVNGQVEIRPMMYTALTYDHRLVDGREAATFLVKLREVIEDPRRLLLDV